MAPEGDHALRRSQTAASTPELQGIFPTFFLAGFECSTFLWKDGQRKDYVRLTGHDRHLEADYAFLKDLGISAIREGVAWPFVDAGSGRYDFGPMDEVLECARECQISPIWDLCHYGFPDGCDPFDEKCVRRFIEYCQAVAERVCHVLPEPHFYTPINEISFFAAAGTDMGWCYPFAKGRFAELKWALCRLAIEGAKAIRAVDPGARMVHVDPLIHSVPPPDRPDLADEAYQNAYVEAYEAWDTLAGLRYPELGGSLEVLDIVGVNVYAFSQAQLNADQSREVLGPRDPRRRPLHELLQVASQRYHRPVIIGETSGAGDDRASWLRMVMEESLLALNAGVDLQGVCLFPAVDMPDWNSGEWARIGICDIKAETELKRCPVQDYVAELRRWQRILDQPEGIDPDSDGPGGFGDGQVDLREVRDCARRWAEGAGIELQAELDREDREQIIV
jgi:hypothetical protein